MNGMRKVLCFLMAMMLAAFALPGFAADKLFTVTVTVTDVNGHDTSGLIAAGVNSMVLLDIANKTPLGVANSVINQFQVPFPPSAPSLPTGDPNLRYKIMPQSKTVNNGTCPASPLPNLGDSVTGTATIQNNNITGVKTGGHYCLYLEVTTSLSACTLTTWTVTASTGGGNGQPFFDFNNQSLPYTLVTTYDGCDGTLACNQTSGAITRGADWGTSPAPGGNCSAKIDYDFNFDPTGHSATSFITIKNGQNFTVQYLLVWNPVPLASVDDDGDGVPDFHPLVSYGTVGNGLPQNYPNNFDFVPAPACLSGPDVLDPGFDPNAVMPAFPNVFPYYCSTSADPACSGITLPPQFKNGVPAKMCIERLDWVTYPGGMVQERALIIDQSDSSVWP